MNIRDAIFGRRTIHNYIDTVVPPAVLRNLIEAAHQAPNHKLTWPWQFTVVGPETRQELLPVAYELKNADSEHIQLKIRNKLLNPGGLIVVTQKRCDDPFRSKEDYAATCCAIQNLMLAAYGENLGTKWSTGALTQPPKVCEILGIDLDTDEVVGFIWVGTPATTPDIPRPSLEDHIVERP